MYSASATFQTKIKEEAREIHWGGRIKTTGGATYLFTDANIVNGGDITRVISSKSLDVGAVYAASLSIELVLPGVSRYELYGGTIEMKCSLVGATDVIPMGIYIISEVVQTSDHIKIKAYDNMIKFDDVKFSPSANARIQMPYKWLEDACSACGVTLGVTQARVYLFPNGARKTGFADVVSDVETWRDALSYITAYLGCYAFINRDGELELGRYRKTADDTIPANFRFSSGLSDYRTTYDGIYGTCKASGVQEYVPNSNSGGLVLDLGTNPFLQFTSATTRLSALSAIINEWNGIYYCPYSSEMPLNPLYDPGDILEFTGNQASTYDIGAITEITYKIGGKMSVVCAGDNPRLAAAQDRFSKTVSGLSSDYNNGQESGGKDFWLLYSENAYAVTFVDGEKKLVDKIEWEQSVDVQRVGLVFNAELEIDDTSTVEVSLTVDDSFTYRFDLVEEKLRLGKRIINASKAWRVKDKGNHVAKVLLTVTKNPLLWSDMA
jgi:hypothetical protein